MVRSLVLTSLFLLFFMATWSLAQEDPSEVLSTLPKSPNASLDCLEVRAGFRVELVAAEPLIADPIAIAWGPDAKLWVVEMGDYPLGSDQNGGRIRYLEDTDDDGRYDVSTVFLQGLAFPTGVMPWRNGVLVTCAPDLFYAEDTDGDGKADHRELLFSGFGQGNPQHRVNGLRWGLDNWIHCANGDSGGMIQCTKTDQQIDIRGHDFRIRPGRGLLELQTGMSQFSRCRDDWGNWFGGNSDWPFWHCVLDDHYLRRAFYLRPPDPRAHLMDPEANAPIFPISPALPRINERTTTNCLTSTCGIAVYRDELFGPSFAHSYFVCEPEHNLVHHQVMLRRGVTFVSKRPPEEQDTEFLASRDVWFRPTQARTGPDGALWIVDMYRLVIEHPEWIREEWRGRLDLRAGNKRGRIYRVVPKNVEPRRIVKLDRLDSTSLVAAMDSPNGPQRDMVQQLIVERQDQSAVKKLQSVVAHSKRAASRLQALCTLDGLDAGRVQILTSAIHDPHPAIRRHAIRLCEPLLKRQPKLQEMVLECVNDPDPQVRLQLALSLGHWNDRRAASMLARVAANDADRPFIVTAVMSSLTNHPKEVLAEMFRVSQPGPQPVTFINELLRLAIYTDQESMLALGLNKITEKDRGLYQEWQFDVLVGVLDDLDHDSTSLEQLRAGAGIELRSAIDGLVGVFEAARAIAIDPQQPIKQRTRTVRLLGRGFAKRRDDDVQFLAGLLAPRSAGALQHAAVEVLGNLDRSDVPVTLLAHWANHEPDLRVQILDVLLSRNEWTAQLLDRIESQQVSVASLGAAHRAKLVLHNLAEVRQRTAVLLDTPIRTDRRLVVERYRNELGVTGDSSRGETIFREHCAICHRVANAGYDVGPDLRTLNDRSTQSLLVAILDPSRKVELRYQAYNVVTVDGRIFTGLLTNEAGNSITLVGPQGKRHNLLRAELERLQSTGKSMMPNGLEQLLPEPQDLADLIAYVAKISASNEQ
ncbi:MAG: HEAT repeat domain-containing protein [Pirellulaceae bacterium]|jgi:putative membrane-bound dehydrogenase-like protein|nr:HEAT repeat domain-containing protein [Pirellulaceae bacterium]